MLLKDHHLTESYFISSFISGVKEEIKPMLRLLKPSSLIEAFEIAVMQEQSLEVMQRKHKWGSKGWGGQKGQSLASQGSKPMGNVSEKVVRSEVMECGCSKLMCACSL